MLERAKQKGSGASPKLYTSAISTYGERKQWWKSIELLREMETKGVAPDVASYNAAITAAGPEESGSRLSTFFVRWGQRVLRLT